MILKRIPALAAALLLFLCWAAASPGRGIAPADRQDASARLRGLSLWVTLPYSEYGPGTPIKVMCTYKNRGNQPMAVFVPSKAEAIVRAEGRAIVYTPQSGLEEESGGKGPKAVTLNPGENHVWSFTILPGRRDLFPGDYPLVVRAAVEGPPPSAGTGATSVAGTLQSNEVVLRIRYKILWVG